MHKNQMSRVLRKPAFCICENKDADQLREAFVFATQIVQSLYLLYPKFQASSHFCNCTPRFVSDQVVKPVCWFSHDWAQKAKKRTKLDLMFMKHYAPNRCLYIKVAKLRTGVGSAETSYLQNCSVKLFKEHFKVQICKGRLFKKNNNNFFSNFHQLISSSSSIS